MAGTLYIVATPIGNLDDMPPRVAATFGAADLSVHQQFFQRAKVLVRFSQHSYGS